ncbi:reverse transcriptase domain-containing protein [Tanacetum coccineum]|uniref:Reverse transcriptase domain-containing protein n=1 Tax=Tanacetum coccineum TaxID=301880 RepID=A0ABQ5C0G2_9ASTR
MVEKDEQKTSFYTGKGVYSYRKIPFGLKNAGATYQRLVDKAFSKQIGRNIEAYVDDMGIKSRSEEDLLLDIQEMFDQLWAINRKLNPKKRSFGVEEGHFLEHLIMKQGIKSSPLKFKAITDLHPPKILEDADEAFKRMKELIETLPTLIAPIKGKVLFMYITASEERVNAVLLDEREKSQIPIFFVSRVLQGAELNYPDLENLIMALVHAARRLRRYFQAHPIIVLTDKPIKHVLSRPKNPEGYPDSKEYTYALWFEFEAANNEAEYEALLVGPQIAQEMRSGIS